MFKAALVIISKNWKQPKCPLMGKWINKLWYVPLMKYYSIMKRIELLIQVAGLSQALCWVTEAGPRRWHVVWFQLDNIISLCSNFVIPSYLVQVQCCLGFQFSFRPFWSKWSSKNKNQIIPASCLNHFNDSANSCLQFKELFMMWVLPTSPD